MQARSRLYVLQLKRTGCDKLLLSKQHAAACVVDLVNTKNKPFAVEIWDPLYPDFKDLQAYYAYLLASAFSEIHTQADLDQFYKDNPPPKDLTHVPTMLSDFKTWQSDYRNNKYDISILDSEETQAAIMNAYNERFPEDFFEKNFDGEDVTCVTPVDWLVKRFEPSPGIDCMYKAYQYFCCLFGLPCILPCCSNKECDISLTVFPRPPCICDADTPGDIQRRAKMRESTNKSKFFLSVDSSSPLLPKTAEQKQAPRPQYM